MFVPRRRELLSQIAGTDERLRGAMVNVAARNPTEQEADHVVGDAGEPAFQNSFTGHTAAGFGAPRFWKTSDGWVHLAGVVKGPATAGVWATAAFTLPTGYRPPYEQVDVRLPSIGERTTLFTTSAVDPQIPGYVYIPAEGRTNEGDVRFAFPFVFAVQTAAVSLDGLSFRVS